MLWSTTTQKIETVVTTHWNPNRTDNFFVAKIVTFAITRNVLKMHQHTNSDKLLSLFPRYSFRRFSLRGTQHLLEVGGLSRIWRVLTDHAQPKNMLLCLLPPALLDSCTIHSANRISSTKIYSNIQEFILLQFPAAIATAPPISRALVCLDVV